MGTHVTTAWGARARFTPAMPSATITTMPVLQYQKTAGAAPNSARLLRRWVIQIPALIGQSSVRFRPVAKPGDGKRCGRRWRRRWTCKTYKNGGLGLARHGWGHAVDLNSRSRPTTLQGFPVWLTSRARTARSAPGRSDLKGNAAGRGDRFAHPPDDSAAWTFTHPRRHFASRPIPLPPVGINVPVTRRQRRHGVDPVGSIKYAYSAWRIPGRRHRGFI